MKNKIHCQEEMSKIDCNVFHTLKEMLTSIINHNIAALLIYLHKEQRTMFYRNGNKMEERTIIKKKNNLKKTKLNVPNKLL